MGIDKVWNLPYNTIVITNKTLLKRTYWIYRTDLTNIDLLANKKGVSQSDIVRMAIKEYIKRESRKI